MRIRTDDEVYRVDAVWLGPPKATFPWRARYVAWGIGMGVFLLVLLVERRMGIGFSFFSTAWAVVITIVATRMIGKRISHERPLGAVTAMWLRELTAPRYEPQQRGGAATAAGVRVNEGRPRRRPNRRDTGRRDTGRRDAVRRDADRGGSAGRDAGRREPGRREEVRRARTSR